nr:[FeFe] hydrogenase H-cluster radical SAM maturase HydE [Tenuifilaceae bacterium]
MTNIAQLLEKDNFSKEELVQLLSVTGEEKTQLFTKAAEIKEKYIGRKVYFRGLIEMSNICSKNCFYCGIRAGNNAVKRYTLTDDEVIDAAKFAWENKYGSIALQTGEVSTKEYVDRI